MSDELSVFEENIEALQNRSSRKKATVEDTHKRTTFLMRRDLLERLDKLSEAQGRGYKTEFFNRAIESMLVNLEKK